MYFHCIYCLSLNLSFPNFSMSSFKINEFCGLILYLLNIDQVPLLGPFVWVLVQQKISWDVRGLV